MTFTIHIPHWLMLIGAGCIIALVIAGFIVRLAVKYSQLDVD